MTNEELLKQAYTAFNARDIDEVLALMAADVDWPNGMEGGRVAGHDAVRSYWLRQWRMINPTVTPQRFAAEPDGRIAVQVHQVVCDLQGNLLAAETVHHVYRLDNGLIQSMEIRRAGE